MNDPARRIAELQRAEALCELKRYAEAASRLQAIVAADTQAVTT